MSCVWVAGRHGNTENHSAVAYCFRKQHFRGLRGNWPATMWFSHEKPTLLPVPKAPSVCFSIFLSISFSWHFYYTLMQCLVLETWERWVWESCMASLEGLPVWCDVIIQIISGTFTLRMTKLLEVTESGCFTAVFNCIIRGHMTFIGTVIGKCQAVGPSCH